MIHIKKIYLAVLTMTIIGCTEIYVPDVNTNKNILVVEGLVTDGDGPFLVKLTEALSYDSDSNSRTKFIPNAKMTVLDNENQVFELTHIGFGVYSLPATFKAKVGNSYKLHIVTIDKNIYESNAQTLLPPETFDSIHTSIAIIKSQNEAFLQKIFCYDIRVDLFHSVSAANPSPLCRFESNVVTHYDYKYNLTIDPKTDTFPSWGWSVIAWKTTLLDERANLTEERSKSANPQILDHFLCNIPYGLQNYSIYNVPEYANLTYYYRFNQYTLNDESYQFYKEANSQLAASGKLFDPISSQLYGNMRCITDSSRIVLGLFEVSSVTKSAYIVSGLPTDKTIKLRKVPYVNISPEEKYNKYKYSIFPDSTIDISTDPDYIEIPLPGWWYHN